MGQRAAGKPLQGRCERFHQAALNVGLVEADLAALDQVPQFAAARTVVNERHRPPAKRRPVHRAVFDDLHTPLMLALRMTASVTMRSGSPGLQISANSGRLGSRRSSTVEALADGVSRSGSGCAGSMRKRSRSMAGGPPVCGASACWGGANRSAACSAAMEAAWAAARISPAGSAAVCADMDPARDYSSRASAAMAM